MKRLQTKTSVAMASVLLATYEGTGTLTPFGLTPSPDGRLVAYVFGDASGAEGDLWVFSPRTGARKCLVWDDHWYWSPSWVPTSDELVACSSRTGSGEVWKFRLDEGLPQLLTNHGKNVSHAQLAPNGKKIAFFSSKTGAYELWIMDSDGTNQQQLTSSKLWVDPFQTLGGRPPLALAWSPDSSAIAFSSIEQQHQKDAHGAPLPGHSRWLLQLQTITFDSLRPQVMQVVFSAAGERRDSGLIQDLSWHPTGDKLAFRLALNDVSSLLIVSRHGVVEHRFDCLNSLSKSPWSKEGRRFVYGPIAERLECVDLKRGTTTIIDTGTNENCACREAVFLPDSSVMVGLFGNKLNSFTFPVPTPKHIELRYTTQAGTERPPEMTRRGELERRAATIKSELESLVVSGDPEMLEFAASTLEDVSFHWLAARAMAAIGSERVQSTLLNFLTSPDPIVRAGAVQAAELLVDAHGLKPDREMAQRVAKILRGASSDLPRARVLAANLLGKCNAGQAIRDLLHTAIDPDDNVRISSVIAMGRIGDPMSIPGIMAAPGAGKPSYVEFEEGVAPLDFGRQETWNVGGGNLAYGDPVDLAKVKALALMDCYESLVTLEKLSAHSDAAVRYWALRMLVGMKGVEMQRVFETALLDREPAVRALAISALQHEGMLPVEMAEPFRLEATKELYEYGGADEIKWEVAITCSITNTHVSELRRVAASACCGERPEVEELGTLAPGAKRNFIFFFVLAAWETPPESLNIVVESSEGIRQVFPVEVR